jgi:hypothetical protein
VLCQSCVRLFCILCLLDMVRFFNGGTNLFRFNMRIVYLRLIIFSVIDNVPVDSDVIFNQLREY